jgi:50S ribosomal subunit-associated GTPase HflX
VAAFRGTLEEVCEADVIVHVVDASSRVWRKQLKTVKETLSDLQVNDKPMFLLWNKVCVLSILYFDELSISSFCSFQQQQHQQQHHHHQQQQQLKIKGGSNQ